MKGGQHPETDCHPEIMALLKIPEIMEVECLEAAPQCMEGHVTQGWGAEMCTVGEGTESREITSIVQEILVAVVEVRGWVPPGEGRQEEVVTLIEDSHTRIPSEILVEVVPRVEARPVEASAV